MIDPRHLGLFGEGHDRVSSGPFADGDWRRLVDETENHRTIGWLVDAVAAGRLAATDAQREELFRRHERLMHHALVLEDEGRRVTSMLESSGVRSAIFKGVAAAHVDHADPSLRTFQDVDLLIRPGDIDAAVGVLTAAGYRRDLPPRNAGWDRRFSKDITFVAPSGAEIDVHRTLVPGPFGFTIDLEELAVQTVPFRLGDVEVRGLGPERRVLASALALTAGEASARLGAALDMSATLCRHDVDIPEVIDLGERWRISSLVAEAVRWSVEQLGAEAVSAPLRSWAEARQEERWERRWRRLYRSAGGSNTATLLGAPLGMRRWSDRRDYLHGLIRPSAAYRLARDRSARPREWRTGAGELVRRRDR